MTAATSKEKPLMLIFPTTKPMAMMMNRAKIGVSRRYVSIASTALADCIDAAKVKQISQNH